MKYNQGTLRKNHHADGSITYDVLLRYDSEPLTIELNCTDERHADRLVAELDAAGVEFNPITDFYY